MELGLQSFNFHSHSLQGEIKGFLSFNSLSEMIFWDADRCQSTKTIKKYLQRIWNLFLCTQMFRLFSFFILLLIYKQNNTKQKHVGEAKNIRHSSQPEKSTPDFVVIIYQAIPSPNSFLHIVLSVWWQTAQYELIPKPNFHVNERNSLKNSLLWFDGICIGE